ncbi:hypothetical protein [Amycolatopsis aidingensis]|uniref:hypothetical protein n=1 Tax=Amycolatopsis aidingensis TaxID=2842453 RepID=UPI001C0E54AC|nr:hypothetical protein [Amycolatopsis aidingensis]
MDTGHDGARLRVALDEARRLVDYTGREVTTSAPGPVAAHAVVEGVHHLASALAGLVNALIERVPAAVAGSGRDEHAANEVVADLRAMHGCLTTGVLLLEPTLDDLHGLVRQRADGEPDGAATAVPDAPFPD